MGMGRGNRTVEMPKSKPMKSLARVFKYVFVHYKLRMFVVLLSIIFSSIALISLSLFIKDVIDVIIPAIDPVNPDYGPLITSIISTAAILYSGVLLSYLYSFIMVTISEGVLREIRNEMFENMQKLPISYFDTHPTGDIMSRYTNDNNTLRQMLSQSIPNVVASLITIISVMITMFVLSWLLTLIVILVIVLMFVVMTLISKRSGRQFMIQQRTLGALNAHIEEIMEGQKVVKVYNHEPVVIEAFDQLNEELFESAARANALANSVMPTMGSMGILQYVLIAIVGSLVAIGLPELGITLGIIASFLQLSRNATQPIGRVGQQVNFIVMALAGAERIFALIDEEKEIDEGTVTLVNTCLDDEGNLIETLDETSCWAWKKVEENDVKYFPLKGDVRFFNVDFSYIEGKQVLYDVNLYAEPGQKVAFVGATGAGKTTITNLINRFYDIQNGLITYDSIPIKDIKKEDLRLSLAVVLQDTHIFSNTVKENIRYGKLDATDEEVMDAAKRANAHEFIMTLPNGYDTFIHGDGSDLSQGQLQLISVARAAIKNPPVLILDEATSSIDTYTESLVTRGMDELMAGRTSFVIAHRLSTVRDSNVIMVLENGRIVERGSHDSLLNDKGIYYQLYTGLFELE